MKKDPDGENDFTKEESERIINLFAIDGGNYPEIMKEIPGVRQKKVRNHLKKLFESCLDIITIRVQRDCERQIREWDQDERVEIIRELHRIRSSNRLLSENNQHFREKMTTLMHSIND